MRYHFIVNMDAPDVRMQMQEQKGFAETYLSEWTKGEAILLTASREKLYQCDQSNAKEAIAAVAENDVPETFLEALMPLICNDDLYLFSGELQNVQLAVRMGYRTGGSSVNGAHGIFAEDNGQVTVRRMMYANHMEAVCGLCRPPYFCSLANGLERAELLDRPFEIKEETFTAEASGHVVSEEIIPDECDHGLEDADVVIAGGRGIGGRSGMELLYRVAQAAGGRAGVSRPAAMNAWAPMDQMIGVSGKLLHPQICIAAGVSGSAAFYAGIEKSKWITAVNRDVKAPIMQMADVAIAEDYAPFMEELEELMRK